MKPSTKMKYTVETKLLSCTGGFARKLEDKNMAAHLIKYI